MRKKSSKKSSSPIPPEQIHAFLTEVFGEDLHAKRVFSLSQATLGVLTAASLAIHAIGRGLAAADGLLTKHAIKQVDRLLSNPGIVLEDLEEDWVAYALACRTEARINLDWTDFHADGHQMLVLSLQTHHGRSTPLLWKTVPKKGLKGKQNAHEDELLVRLHKALPDGVKVTIVADRGFFDTKFLLFLEEELCFDYVIRIRSNIQVTSATGETRKAKDWLSKSGRARVLRHAKVTGEGYAVCLVACLKDKGMKDCWCIVATDPDRSLKTLKGLYGKRFSCEEWFRDLKDPRFGLGMKWSRIRRTDRRDRLMLLAVFAHALLTLLGAAGEDLGMDRSLYSNTAKRRQLSLFRQGLFWYQAIPNMPEKRLKPLMKRFGERLLEHAIYEKTLGVL